ncbi:hypothetical protein WOA01_20060 [Methylocystis sp. IM2]|uniref:hypothetical protein n=1 Tax=unclassified Methylocystis TaxID=2625913 RepID=UPI0030F50590
MAHGLDALAQLAQRAVGEIIVFEALVKLVERGARPVEPGVDLFDRRRRLVGGGHEGKQRRNQQK